MKDLFPRPIEEKIKQKEDSLDPENQIWQKKTSIR